MRFTINLVTRTYLDHRLLNRAGFVVIALLLLLLAFNVKQVSTNFGEQRRLVSEINSFEAARNIRPGGVSEKEFGNQQSRIRFYNEIINRKGVGWIGMLNLVESVTPNGISLSALTPGKKHGELKLEGRAKSFGLVRKYVEQLEGASSFSEVLLLSHQELLVGENGRGVQFAISCRVMF